ncbi:hypothetical protein HY213_04710 [Candidatus Peregrinibacteria bacterium]|nr:hypothetical protein [Candidatus Peregrinibacteria bacterium]
MEHREAGIAIFLLFEAFLQCIGELDVIGQVVRLLFHGMIKVVDELLGVLALFLEFREFLLENLLRHLRRQSDLPFHEGTDLLKHPFIVLLQLFKLPLLSLPCFSMRALNPLEGELDDGLRQLCLHSLLRDLLLQLVFQDAFALFTMRFPAALGASVVPILTFS